MDMDRYIGRLLDNRYEILEVIGTGGMAVVYKARCHRLNRLVAIKILRAEYTKDEEFRRRFHAESQAVAMLSHPNIVSVYDVSTTDEADYIVMELIDGITLKQYMEKKGTLNWKETLHFAIQIAKALEHAHSRGIIHRDIKPHNVMVLKNGSVKVTDFGIARVMSESNTLTKEALGSVHYISPEQAKGGRVDNRSDLYSLGVVMYEMTTGRPPYDGETPVAVAIQHINSKATLPSMINPNIPGGLEQIIVRSMSQNPKDRYPSAGALLTDLDEFRKNPTILFDYNNPDTDIDAATRMQPPARIAEGAAPAPKTTTENNTARTAPPRPRTSSNRPAPAPAKKPARRREVIVEDKEERSKVATIAIIACAAVAFAAIILFCIVFFGSDLLSSNEQIMAAPNLVGQMFDANKSYGNVTVELSKKDFSDTYAEGEIMHQTPAANADMVKGGVIKVEVSLGPRPKDAVMVNVCGSNYEEAKTHLKTIEPDLNFFIRWQSDPKVKENCVISTDPVVGEELTKGQTVVLLVSTGPVQELGVLPNVVGKSQAEAIRTLGNNGFNNYSVIASPSSEPKGVVIEQSVPGGTNIDKNTTITITVSSGMPENPDNNTTPPEDNSIEMLYTLSLQEEAVQQYLAAYFLENPDVESCVLGIWKGTELVEEREFSEGTWAIELKLRGEGTVTFTAMINEDITTVWTFDVTFVSEDTDSTVADE